MVFHYNGVCERKKTFVVLILCLETHCGRKLVSVFSVEIKVLWLHLLMAY